jgi:O-antigen/teichoic acid export membrane protein
LSVASTTGSGAPAARGAAPVETTATAAGAHASAATPLRANFGWTLAGNVVYAGGQWVMLLVVAKLAPPETVGTVALGFAVTAPVFLLAGLHLRASQATDAARRFRFPDYLSVRLAGMGAALLATGVIVALSSYDGPTRLIVLAVAASKAVEGVSDVYYGAMQQHERMRPIAISLMLRGVLATSAFAIVLRASGRLLPALAALAAAWILVLVLHDRPAAARVLTPAVAARGAAFDPRAAGRIVAISLPLGLVVMLVSLRTNIPRYFIEARLGAAELGIFAALYSLLAAGSMVIGALGQSATPRLARHFHAGEIKAFRRLLARLLGVACVVGGGGAMVALVAGKPLLALLFGAPYAARSNVLAWLMASGLAAYGASFLGYALTAARRFTVQLPLFSVTTLVCAGLCAWLVPAHGLVGAALAWGGVLLVELAATWVLLEHALRERAARGSP